jgi:serine protease Do
MTKKLALYPLLAILIAGLALAAWMNTATRPAAAEPPVSVPPNSPPIPPLTQPFAQPPAQPPTQPPAMLAPSAPGDSGVDLRRTVTVQVVEKTKNAVVNISTRKLVDRHVTLGGPFIQPFDTGQVVRVPANSLGSGFIVQKDGYVVTNNHVVDRAREISVELADGRKLSADLISADPDADLAVLRIHSSTPLPTLDLGESSDLMIGEPVIAVGNPLGYSHSVSTGIVSALHRDIEPKEPDATDDAQPVHGEEAALRDLVQTDAAINPGNSGGPLLNAYGQVIGINTAIRGDAQNIGFAIPIDRLRDLIPELMNPSQVTKVDVPLKLVEKRTITEPANISVTLTSPTVPGTSLRSIDGQHPANIIDAYAMLLSLKPRQAFQVIWADDQTQRLVTKVTPIPDAIVETKQKFGLTIEQINPMLADKYKLNQEDGLLVDAVDRDSAAAKSGLAPGDIIVQVGRVRVASLDDLGALMPRLPEQGSIRVWVIRGQEMGYITLKF